MITGTIFVAGQYAPTATLIGARHMPSTDDLKTIIVSLATLPTNLQTTKSGCVRGICCDTSVACLCFIHVSYRFQTTNTDVILFALWLFGQVLLHYLLTEAPRAVIQARSHYVWRAGGLILLLQAMHTFRKHIDMVVLCLKCMSRVLNTCPEGNWLLWLLVVVVCCCWGYY
jgi:hypothetical protein